MEENHEAEDLLINMFKRYKDPQLIDSFLVSMKVTDAVKRA
jgi:hypothetical protein